MVIKEIRDKTIWENFIQKQKYTSLFQSWRWMEFERAMGRSMETLGIFKGNILHGLIPVRNVRAYRGKYIWIRRGPIFDFSDKTIWTVFFEFITKKAKQEGNWFIRLSPLILEADEIKYLDIFRHLKDCPMHDTDGEITLVLDLEKSEDEILSNMRKNTRYYIKKAKRDGVKIIKTQDQTYLKYFWTIYQDTVKRHKWTAYDEKYIRKEFNDFVKDDLIDLYLAEYKGKFIAGSLIVYYGNQAIYHHSGSLSEFSKITASYLIQWEAIKEAKRRGLKQYNLWGVSPLVKDNERLIPEAGHPWEGLTFFKLGFGGKVQQYMHAKDLPVSWKYNLTRGFEIVERWRRGY
jgi:peptidoglycan pentaglycine glycine transferase (the first glycine)